MTRKWLRTGLIILIIGAIIGIIAILYVFRKSPDSVGSKKPDVTIDATALTKAFEEDENAANTLYLNKIILVTGTIESVAENGPEISLTLKESDDIAGVICSFSKETIDLQNLAEGKKISVKGICNGYLMDVVLSKCSLNE
jgi:hypothetical protein